MHDGVHGAKEGRGNRRPAIASPSKHSRICPALDRPRAIAGAGIEPARYEVI